MEQGTLLIAAVLPEFYEKDQAWFSSNERKIISLSRKEPWWKNHVFVLEEGRVTKPLELLRRLSDFGYTKVSRARYIGDISVRGGFLAIAPVG